VAPSDRLTLSQNSLAARPLQHNRHSSILTMGVRVSTLLGKRHFKAATYCRGLSFLAARPGVDISSHHIYSQQQTATSATTWFGTLCLAQLQPSKSNFTFSATATNGHIRVGTQQQGIEWAVETLEKTCCVLLETREVRTLGERRLLTDQL
jgi:hypothetical protein